MAKSKRPKNGGALVDEALQRNISAFDAHSDALHIAARVTMALSRQQILLVLGRHWVPQRPTDVAMTDPLSDYLTGGPGYIANYYTVLNPLFPGLALTRNDMINLSASSKVSVLIDIIVRGLTRSRRTG